MLFQSHLPKVLYSFSPFYCYTVDFIELFLFLFIVLNIYFSNTASVRLWEESTGFFKGMTGVCVPFSNFTFDTLHPLSFDVRSKVQN